MTGAPGAAGAALPWLGSVIGAGGVIVARGRTQGPGEDHAEIGERARR